jgi:hypothetical protein
MLILLDNCAFREQGVASSSLAAPTNTARPLPGDSEGTGIGTCTMPRFSPAAFAALVLGGLLILAVTFLVHAWGRIEAQMSIHGWIALSLGIVVSLAVGVGLMALVFFSARRGYDDGVGPGDDNEPR